ERFNKLPEDRQRQILNGAMQAFAEHGYEKCSTADVAGYAGVSKALLFHYFNTKIELFDYLNSYTNSLRHKARQKHVIKPEEDLLEAFAKLVKQRISLVQLNPLAYRFLKRNMLTDNLQPAEQDIADLQKTDVHRLRKGYTATEVVKLLGWLADGFIEDHLAANSNTGETLTDLENWLPNLKKMFYKDKHQ
ncbi:MAG: helix-turn-helix domain-containing protein, partial [Anaerolineaceae bacterium]